MRKLLIALFLVSAVAATSCKKDSGVTPAKTDKSIKMDGGTPETITKGDVSSWD